MLRPARLLALALFASGFATAATAAEPAFPIRMVKLGGAPSTSSVAAHVAFCRSIGFNALWVDGPDAGAWTRVAAPRGPIVRRDFLGLARGPKEERLSLWVAINPVGETAEGFVFDDPEGEDRIVRFARTLNRRAGVRNLVLSFEEQPRQLTEFRDIVRYGLCAASAHVDLARRVAARLPAGMRLWLLASAYCDAHLGNGTGPYAKELLEGLPALPPSVGIVWTGPTPVSAWITAEDIEATRRRLGGRDVLLRDNYPRNDDDTADAIALVLGPLRHRGASLPRAIAAYLACPMNELGGSRATLLTIADYLRDPAGYDADASRASARARLAGPNAPDATRVALDTQMLEWGGFVDELNYHPRDALNAPLVAARLSDPAFVSSFTWTVDRYPGRIANLAGLADAPFREDLLRTMRRRLAIARAVPLTIEYQSRRRAGRADADAVLALLAAERRSWLTDPDALRVLDLFLSASGSLPVD